ncbi:adenylate kinase [Guggenheimella bovis]
MRLLLIGPPNAGKGTQAGLLTSKYDIPHVSTGNILRDQIARETPLGLTAKPYVENGKLVPDELVMALVASALDSIDLDRGFLFDGYPRNVAQAENLTEVLRLKGKPLDAVVLLQVDEDQLVKRATGRRVCSKCSKTYHVSFNPPQTENVCDACGSDLIQRKDDQPETVKSRLEVYKNQTEPLVEYFSQQGTLKPIDGSGAPDEVFNRVVEALKDIR